MPSKQTVQPVTAPKPSPATLHEWRVKFDTASELAEFTFADWMIWCAVNQVSRDDCHADYAAEVVANHKSFLKNDKPVAYNTAVKMAKEKGWKLPRVYRRWQTFRVQANKIKWCEEKVGDITKQYPAILEEETKQGVVLHLIPAVKAESATGSTDTGNKDTTITISLTKLQEFYDTNRGKIGPKEDKLFMLFCAMFDIELTRAA